jgi:cation diffusion facilitator CzcD-associated flavoprotein CzcO|tara:strand:- start:1654 stop:3219 length:1566 start_codon:yes stop_codon:yes gene_type:complete
VQSIGLYVASFVAVKIGYDMQDFDVVIVGAGISGVSAAYHLQQSCPTKSFTILESRKSIGGTWDLFKYPGIRSDSDMHTLGFNFKPWIDEKSIADGPSIKRYLSETIAENKMQEHIQHESKLIAADWSSESSRWMISVEQKGHIVEMTCNFLMMCSGYYNYETPYTPEFAGQQDFQGQVVHPQHWPEDLDYQDKQVVVIGSGATAMTLIPAMAEKAGHVTMLQRSPTYVAARPDHDAIANTLRKFLPGSIAYAITRFKNTQMQKFLYGKMRAEPEKMKRALVGMVRKALGPKYDVEKHFTPKYNPWDQRLCLVPNGDLFTSIKAGDASVVTDHIDHFTEEGIALKSGEILKADIIVTATGLNMQVMGGAAFSVDDRAVDFPGTFSYKGMMYSDVPNLIQTFGYINASWTLRADLTSEYACRLINHMDAKGVSQCTARLREEDMDMPARPWIEDFSAGYMQRAMQTLPKQGDKDPWRNTQNYALDKKIIRKASLEDGALVFGPTDLAEGHVNASMEKAQVAA